MTETNTHRSINDWMIHIDGKLDRLNETLGDKLDDKCDKEDCVLVEGRVHDLELKTGKLAIKQAGIAATVSILLLSLKAFFSPS